MRNRQHPGARRRGSWLGGLIRHDPEFAGLLVSSDCVVATWLYATGRLAFLLDEFKAGLLARLARLVPLLPGVCAACRTVGLLLLLLLTSGIVRLVPRDQPRCRKQLVLGRQRSRAYTVRPDERRAHLTVVGLSGMGKSKAVASWVAQDILREREASLVLDIHQTLIDDVLG